MSDRHCPWGTNCFANCMAHWPNNDDCVFVSLAMEAAACARLIVEEKLIGAATNRGIAKGVLAIINALIEDRSKGKDTAG